MSEPNWTTVPTGQNVQTPPPPPSAPAGYISREELDRILEERDRKHAEEIAVVRAKLPVAQVPANSGGPGIDNHQVSWNLAEQESAARGEILDHWVIRD